MNAVNGSLSNTTGIISMINATLSQSIPSSFNISLNVSNILISRNISGHSEEVLNSLKLGNHINESINSLFNSSNNFIKNQSIDFIDFNLSLSIKTADKNPIQNKSSTLSSANITINLFKNESANSVSNSSTNMNSKQSVNFIDINSPQSTQSKDESSIRNKASTFISPNMTMNLPLAKELAQNLLSRIYHRYELDGAGYYFWHTIQNMGEDIWDIVKYKFAKKALIQNEKFLMIFGGSSVTAGHDHYFNQSYPAIVDKRMSPVLSAMGIKLEVHNIAQGANPCNPYSLCYEAMGGKDADWIGWEQSYNCGHDEGVSC